MDHLMAFTFHFCLEKTRGESAKVNKKNYDFWKLGHYFTQTLDSNVLQSAAKT